MTDPPEAPQFERNALLNKPGIVGARWWNRGLADQDPVSGSNDQMNRRAALSLLGAGVVGVVAVGGLAVAVAGDDFSYDRRSGLDMQRTYGWDFGAVTENLVFDGTYYLPYDPAVAAHLEPDLAPARHVAFHVPTLLQSVLSSPTSRPAEENVAFRPVYSVLRPVFTTSMDAVYKAGESLATLLRNRNAPVAVVVDLPGPESVAFTAGTSSMLEPVLLIDNWPHPRGVVAAHLTLGAFAYYQPLFVARRAERAPTAMPVFVLDRNRLAFYSDSSERFDNRHMARLPSATALRAAGISKLLYVIPESNALPELDDLNEAFVALTDAGIEVRAVSADSFFDAGQGGVFYGGTPETHEGFWVDYPWAQHSFTAVSPTGISMRPRTYGPMRRATAFIGGRAPPDMGMVSVVLAAGTAAVLGARFNRAGSWNRSSGGWGG